MIDEINKGIEQFQELFDTNFTRYDQESVEILLMLEPSYFQMARHLSRSLLGRPEV